MTHPVEDLPNIGAVLGKRLRKVGIATAEAFEKAGDVKAFQKLCSEFPEDACVHTRLALAGAARHIRWHDLPKDVQAEVTRGLS